MWKMSACLEMQSFSLAPWSTCRQTKNSPGTLGSWDTVTQTTSPREETPFIRGIHATYTGFCRSYLCNPLHIKLGSGTGAPVAAGTVSGLSDVPVHTQQLSWVWIGRLQPFPGITLPIQAPSFQTNHRITFANARAGFKSQWGWWDRAPLRGIPETTI